jgi:hypothetical protein
MDNNPLKLITETNFEDITTKQEEDMILAEGSTEPFAVKNWYITGIFLQGNLKNKNGRVYPIELLEREVTRYNRDFISQKRALGELGHPEGPTVNLDRASHQFLDLHRDGSNFIGKAKILSTQEHGRKVAGFLSEGIKLGISSRGMGSIRNVNGVDQVQNDYFLATAGDIVLDPSAPSAFVNGIYEGKEWVWNNGLLVEHFLTNTKKELDKKFDESKILEAFNQFMKGLS